MVSEGETFDALTQITDHEKPCLYPNGGDNSKNLYFIVEDEKATYNIYKKNDVLKKAIIKKTSGDNYNLVPNFNQINDKILFQYYDRTNFDIYYINGSSGKAISQITNTDDNEYNPSWSPDGTLIAFERGASPKYYVTQKSKVSASRYLTSKVTKNQIWIKDTNSGELKMLGEGSFPKFSPDGKNLVFVRYSLNKSKTKETGNIWIMSVDGEEPRQLTNSDLGYATNPCWSIDGTKIAFQLTKKNKADSDIYTISVDGEDLKQHTTNASNDFSPYWTKDNMIYFSSDRGSEKGDYQIWRFKL